jgi:hypothetical protein
MNFINHSGPGSLDSGDAIECITRGIALARALLAVDWSICLIERELTERAASPLRAWVDAAQALIDATQPGGKAPTLHAITLVDGIDDTLSNLIAAAVANAGELLSVKATDEGLLCCVIRAPLTAEELRRELRIYLGSRRHMSIGIPSSEQLDDLRARGLA